MGCRAPSLPTRLASDWQNTTYVRVCLAQVKTMSAPGHIEHVKPKIPIKIPVHGASATAGAVFQVFSES